MSTLNQLTDQVLGEISSYVRNQDSLTFLKQACTSSDTTLTVDDTTSVNKGIVEIDDELIFVQKSVASSGTLQVLGGATASIGRGYRATTATSHVLGSIVRNNPIFPRTQVKRAINDTIKGMNFPVLANETFEFNGAQYAYVMPDSLVDVTGVSWELPDSTGEWMLIRRWRLDTNYLDNGGTHQALILQEAPMPGRNVRVQYTKYASAITDAQDLSVSGLPASCEDVVRLGAMYRLLSTVDPGKVTANTVSADLIDQPVSPGLSTNAAKYIFQMYTLRLQEEVNKQQNNFLNIIQYKR